MMSLEHDQPAPVGPAAPRIKPTWRGWIHLAAFEVSLVVGTLLIVASNGGAEITATCIYTASVSGLFGASALYHRGNWSPKVDRVLQRLDHMMIFVLIAGTTTPAYLLAVGGGYGVAGLAAMWTLTAIATIVHQIWLHAPDILAASAYVALGIVAAGSLPAMWVHGGVAAGVLIVAGGLLYVVGALTFRRGFPAVSPTVFGYHEVFHLFVAAAAACHYVAIFLLILKPSH